MIRHISEIFERVKLKMDLAKSWFLEIIPVLLLSTAANLKLKVKPNIQIFS